MEIQVTIVEFCLFLSKLFCFSKKTVNMNPILGFKILISVQRRAFEGGDTECIFLLQLLFNALIFLILILIYIFYVNYLEPNFSILYEGKMCNFNNLGNLGACVMLEIGLQI